jgi:hypothetical protein
MCTAILKGQKPLIAEKDIIVYKASYKEENENIFTSMFERYRYLKENLHRAEMTFTNDFCVSDRVEQDYVEDRGEENFLFVKKGFHSFVSIERIRKEYSGGEVAEFIIPKGSKYYSNECGNIVSNAIIFNEWL